MAARITDLHAHRQTRPGARHAGRRVRWLSLEGSFHGRTDPAARVSGVTLDVYRRHLASFRDEGRLTLVEPNDRAAVLAAFRAAEDEGTFFEGFFIEPVMGEGRSGLALTPEFYELARRLTREHGTLLVCDSIQAGFRATGWLSIVDYPGFTALEAPDLETFSKALNGGQYPLSVLALTGEAAALYVTGIYGNTMTTCPRGLEVGCAVLDAVTDELRSNIRARGEQLKAGLAALRDELGDDVRGVEGTGLIVCVELDPARLRVTGVGGLEEELRKRGIHMIHGGTNGLRFTPHFAITAAEVELILDGLRSVLRRRIARGAGAAPGLSPRARRRHRRTAGIGRPAGEGGDVSRNGIPLPGSPVRSRLRDSAVDLHTLDPRAREGRRRDVRTDLHLPRARGERAGSVRQPDLPLGSMESPRSRRRSERAATADDPLDLRGLRR